MSFKKFINHKSAGYFFSFIVPCLTLFIYFAVNHYNVLTVDLGQQYVDLLAFLRSNLFTHPTKLIYSFQNGLGGSMIATDAYYLLSPFNLVLFLFPKSQLPIAILTIISLKFGASGLASFYYWHREKGIGFFYSLAASWAYALSGYMVANYFNLMWLDSVILLPLLIASIDHVLRGGKNHLVLITFLLWFTNFYTGVMTLFFGLLYLLTQIFWLKKSERLSRFWTYLTRSIVASFLAAFVLFPSFFELLANKASTKVNWTFSWQFNPVLELGKLADGSYSFHEMESGMPNLFYTMPFLLATILYFLSRRFSWKKKLANGLLLLFLLLSLSFTPLVLFWHLGQFPVWYPGRFSFVLIFFCLNLALAYLHTEQNPKLWQRITVGVIAISLVSYWYFAQNSFTFFTQTNLITSTTFIVLGLLFFFFIFAQHHLDKPFFAAVVGIEAIASLILSLNNLSFQKNSAYQKFAQNSLQASSYLQKIDPTLYRTEKTFSRSDEDPFTANYNGLSSFNSVTDQRVLKLLANLGFLHNSNSYTNNGGSLITDDIFGIKYYIQPNYASDHVSSQAKMAFDNDNHRIDIDSYAVKKEFKQLLVSKNSTALPLIFMAPVNNQKLTFNGDEPAYNQQKLLQNIIGKKTIFFQQIPFPKPTLSGSVYSKISRQYTKKKNAKQSKITFSIPLKNNDAYYLQLPSGLDNTQMSLYVNNQEVDLTVRDEQSHLISLAHNQKGTKLIVTMVMNQMDLDLSQIKLFELNTTKLNNAIKKLKLNAPSVYQNGLKLTTSTFTSTKKQRLLTTIPASKNWLVFDNGKRLKSSQFASAFMQVELNKGKHHLTFIYVPWLLLVGILLSILALICLKLFFH